MLLRSTGVVITLLGLLLIVLVVFCLFNINSLGAVLVDLSRHQGKYFSVEQWRTHYRLYWLIWLVVGILGCLGGVLMAFKRLSGLALLIVTLAAILVYQLVINLAGLASYRFEDINYPTFGILLAILIFSLAEWRYLVRRAE